MSYEKNLQMARRIAEAVSRQGGTAYYVGGYVRDQLRGAGNKDIDIEIHGISPLALEEILDSLGNRLEMGESFGIYGLSGYEIDIAMPRKEEKCGRGHRDFHISVDPFIGTKKAAMRRDFTINAIMQNILSGEVIDHFGGQEDLKKGTIRHVDAKTFAEDPLRVLRAAQFAARFGFFVAEETISLCRAMPLQELSRERIMGELEKALLKAAMPSAFFTTLREMEQLHIWFPEVRELIGIPQNPQFHPEGDVWTHTMQVLDKAAAYRSLSKNPLGFMLTALTHDFGKIVCTEEIDGILHAYGHEKKGVPVAEVFLHRITKEHALIRYVKNMVLLHMKPHILAADKASVKATNKMYDQSLDPEALIYFSFADGGERDRAFLEERLSVFREYMSRPYVTGQDLMEAGLQPGEAFSEYLAYAHKLRLAGVKKEEALKQTLAYQIKGL